MNCCVKPFAKLGVAGVTAIETNAGDVTVSNVLPLTLPLVAEIVVVPVATVAASPEPALIVALPGSLLAQVTDEVISAVELSLKVPVAVNCCVRPLATVGVAGVTSIDIKAVVMLRVALAETPLDVAEICELPTATPVARPPLVTVAFELASLAQVTEPVMSAMDASEYVPVAVNWRVCETSTNKLETVRAIDCRTGGPMVRLVLPLTDPSAAVTVAVFASIPVASPRLPLALPMPTTTVFDELQVTCVVKSCVLLSVNVPVAVNCCVKPFEKVGSVGVTWIETSVAGLIVATVLPLTLPKVAVIVDEPTAAAASSPALPLALLTVAFAAFELVHVTCDVRFCVEPSL